MSVRASFLPSVRAKLSAYSDRHARSLLRTAWIPVQDERDRRSRCLLARLTDEEPAITRDGILRSAVLAQSAGRDTRGEQSNGCSRVKYRSRGFDRHCHQLSVECNEVEFPAIVAPTRRETTSR